MDLKNKVAIVTGGAMGNGLGIVKTFLKYGAKVIVLDYSNEVKKIATEYKEILGFKLDIRNQENLDKAKDYIEQKFGNVDIIVNNAGVAKLTPFLETTDEIRDLHFDINIKGTWNVTKTFVPLMKQGSIINLSSVTGPIVADSGEVAYATTKAALIGFTKGLAMELVDKNIRVNAILPGYILTPMVEGIAKDTNSLTPRTIIDGIAKGIPMKRLGTPEEIGELAAFLASEQSSYITGQEFVIDGGSTLPETNSVGV